MNDIAGLDDTALAAERGVAVTGLSRTLRVDIGHKPGGQVEFREALPQVPGDVIGRCHTGRDYAAGKCLGDNASCDAHRVRKRFHLILGARLCPPYDEVFRRHQPICIVFRQHLEQALMQRVGEPIGDRPVARHVNADACRVAGDDELAQRLPLRIEIAALPG